ncbi:GHMP kinase [Lacinutrix sp. C3R15]|uniref:GYDIA family GHMP kinase n=1 Tax=Flavobacteriaceae TaxID=49546 RepID=UPI001C0A59CC|nr:MULTISPECIES: GYDIA family GHMP kinase [Flavobacteriaceae]MBU2939211.1 GHMP kinase [Lacinutrix sp. C3R15]MDO6622527.1 GYDIA family GHMP kinase [Oceanihabitans sp. 1_MG-2023]
MQQFYSSGKLLLTGEYVVLDGALALAVPTKFGQRLVVEEIEASKLIWVSLDEQGNTWFKTELKFENHSISLQAQNDIEISNRLLDIFHAAKELNPEFLKDQKGFKITTTLEFPKNWGLGTSSTLINNIATWANVDAYQLLEKTFGGSGYDIACAQNALAITYQLKRPSDCTPVEKRIVNEVLFNPAFKEHLYFVHLNKKQNSREGITHYKKNTNNIGNAITEINKITQNIITCKTIEAFNLLIEKHEQIIAEVTQLQPVKEVLFNDFNGSIKSLGAWGGDFVLVSTKTNPTTYFKNKGYTTILKYEDMITTVY